jgi:dTDP-4-dehydrorhamnose reductase
VLLIVGAGDQLELALVEACAARGIPMQVVRPGELSITDEPALAKHLQRQQAWAVIDATPGNWLDPFPSDVRPLSPLDTRAAATLAAACGRLGIRLLTFSSDHVFDGTKPTPYLESDPIAPRSARGRHHAAIEREVLAAHPDALIVRTSPIFGLHDLETFARGVADVRNELPVDGADQTTTSLTFAPDLIAACLDSLVDGERGILHLANSGAMAWTDLTHLVGYLIGVNSLPRVNSRPAPRAARRLIPPHLVLASERTWIMPPLGNALVRYLGSDVILPKARDQAAA